MRKDAALRLEWRQKIESYEAIGRAQKHRWNETLAPVAEQVSFTSSFKPLHEDISRFKRQYLRGIKKLGVFWPLDKFLAEKKRQKWGRQAVGTHMEYHGVKGILLPDTFKTVEGCIYLEEAVEDGASHGRQLYQPEEGSTPVEEVWHAIAAAAEMDVKPVRAVAKKKEDSLSDPPIALKLTRKTPTSLLREDGTSLADAGFDLFADMLGDSIGGRIVEVASSSSGATESDAVALRPVKKTVIKVPTAKAASKKGPSAQQEIALTESVLMEAAQLQKRARVAKLLQTLNIRMVQA